MSIIGNIIWIVFGGIFIFLQYIFGGIVLCLTIVGIPFGLQCFKFAIVGIPFGLQHFKLMNLAFSPFGKSIN